MASWWEKYEAAPEAPATPAAASNDWWAKYDKEDFSDVQSGAASAAVPEKGFLTKAAESIAEIPEGLYEGTQAGLSNMGGWLSRAATAPAIAFDAAKSAVTGELTTDAQDWMFGNLVDPYKKNEEAYQAELKQKGLPAQIAGGVGQALPDVALAVASGGTAMASKPLVESGAKTLAAMIAESAGMGIKTAAPLAEKAAGERYAQAIAEGKSVGEATAEAIKAIGTTTAMGLTGSGGVGRLGNTIASGLSGEVVREMEGRPFDPAELGTNLALGFGLSGPKQDFSTQAPRLSPADEALAVRGLDTPPSDAPSQVRLPTVDEPVPSEMAPWLTSEATEATESAPATRVATEENGPQNDVQSVLEGTPETVELSPTALRIKEANEQSLRETGKPISADQIRAIREEAVAQDETLDLTPEELQAYQQWQRGQEETPEVSIDDLSPADRALVERSTGADDAVSFLREESARLGESDAEQSGLRTAVKNTLGDAEVTFLRDEDGLPSTVKTKPKADGTVRKGLYDPATGKVYLFTGSGMTPQDAAFTAAHEIAGHKGLRSLAASEAKIGTKSAREWLDTSLSNALQNPTVKAVADSMAAQRKSGDTTLMAEEAMADLAAAVRTGDWKKIEDKHGVVVPEGVRAGVKGVVQKFVEQIRRLVNVTISKATGKQAKFTDAQVNELIENAWKATQEAEAPRSAEPPLESIGGPKAPRSNAAPEEKVTPEVFGKLSSILSWKGGQKYAREFEQAKLEGAAGDFLAQRAVDLFDKAGFKKASEAVQATAYAALHGDKGAEAKLAPAMKTAVRFVRDEVTNYQAQLAGMNVKMDGRDLTDFFYDTIAKDNYLNRAYGVFEIKPSTIQELAHAVTPAGRRGEPWWRAHQQKHNPEAVRNLTKFIEENLIDPNSNRTPQEQVEDLLNQLADPKGFSGSNVEVVRQAARDSSILKARENVPKPIREYWGEFKDPRLQAAYTLSRLGALTAKQGLLTRLAKEGDGKHFFEEGKQPKGYTAKLPENSDYGPLAGKMTRPDIARQLESQVGIEKSTPLHVERQVLTGLFDHYANLSAKAKVAKTVLSFATGAVNAMANVSLVAKVSVQHALMGQFLGIPDFAKASSAVAKDFLGKLDTETGKMLISKGIIRDSAQYGELRKVRSRIEREAAREGSGKVAGAASKVADAGANVFQKIADLYQTPDNFSRAMFFFGEMTIQKKLHPDWTEQKVIEYAANKARDEVPTWGRASPTVKATSRAMGNFATWSGEVIRSYKNQVKNAVTDMVHGETPAQKYYGFSQLAATSTSIALAQTLVPAVISSMFGFDTDDKKKNEAVSKLAPEYFGGDTLSVADSDPKSGKIVFLNATRLDPSAPFHQLWNREMTAIKDDASIPEATWGWIKDSFLTPGPAPQAVGTAVTGKDKFDRKLAPDERAKAVVDAFKPGSAVTLEKIEKLKKRGVDQRVIDATKVGLPLYELDTARAMTYATMDFSESIKDYRAQFNRGYGAAEATPEDQKAKYVEFLRNEKEAFDKIHRQVKALQTIFGEKEGKTIAMDAFKEAKLDKDYVRAIEKGTFVPNPIDEAKTFLDRQEQNAIYNEPSREKEIRKDFAERRRQLAIYRRNYQSLLKQ